jgi:hypothetical protein
MTKLLRGFLGMGVIENKICCFGPRGLGGVLLADC